jgi:multiple sugar transport system permease protein
MRTLIFAPTALSWVVIGVVARSILSDSGPLNGVLQGVGLGSLTQNWLGEPAFSIWAVVLAFNAAVFGGNTVIFLAGFATLDRSMIGAARVDGASAGRTLWSVILPNMLRFVQFVYITTVIASFTGLFGLIYTMTAGGPGYSSTTLEYAVWQNAFTSGDFGLSAALGIFLLLGVLLILSTSRFLSRRSEEGLAS